MKEVELSYLRIFDRILIHTANSIYEFSVTDPASHAGILRGGILGERAITASLLCCEPDQKGCGHLMKLSVGAKALFIYTSANGVRRLITSRVRRLSCASENQSEKNISFSR